MSRVFGKGLLDGSSACLLSIIVPVYNSEQYLASAIGSLLSEPSDEFEVILVDDGSTDDSGHICDRLANSDPRVTAIHIANGGMCHARNFGLSHAKGKWVGFIDNDDAVLPGFVIDNLEVAKKTECDCLVFGRRLEWYASSGKLEYVTDGVPRDMHMYNGDEVKEHYLDLVNSSDGVWNRFYKKSLLADNSIQFDESFRQGNEDTKFNDDVIRFASSYVTIPHCYYVWKRRASHSASMVVNDNKIKSLSICAANEFNLMEDFGLIKTNPDGCAARLFSMFFSTLASNYMSDHHDYSSQVPLFQALNDAVAPYADFILESRLRFDIDIAKTLLLSRHYFALHMYLWLGTKLKSLLNRL